MSRKRRIVAAVSLLLLLAVLSGGAWWHFVQARRAEQVATALAALKPERIRAQLAKSIQAGYGEDADRARRGGDEKKRQKALREAAQARDHKLAQLGKSIQSIESTISSDRASPEFLELIGILQRDGVNAAIQYVSQHEKQLIGEPVLWGRTSPSTIRMRLAPLLEGARLQRDRGDLAGAQRLCEELVAADPDWPEARHEHAATMIASGQRAFWEERATTAWERFRTASTSAERLVQLDPKNPDWQRDLSIASLYLVEASAQIDRKDVALQLLRKLGEITKSQAATNASDSVAQRELCATYEDMGDLWSRIGGGGAASRCYQQSLEIAKQLANADPANAELQNKLSIVYEKAALVSGMGDFARDCLHRSLDIRQKLAAAEPTNSDLQHELSVLYEELGNATWPWSARRGFYQQSLDIRQKLAAANGADRQAKQDLCSAYDKMAYVCRNSDRFDEARNFYLKELDVAGKLAAADRADAAADAANGKVESDLSDLYANLGTLSEQTGEIRAARTYYEKTLAIRSTLAAADPGDLNAIDAVRSSYSHLAHVALTAGDPDLAVHFCERGLNVLQRITGSLQLQMQIRPELISLKNDLTRCRQASIAAGPLDALMKQPARKLPDLLQWRCSLLTARRDIDGVAQAAELLGKLEPKTPSNLYNAACGYARCGKLAAGWPGAGPFPPPSTAVRAAAKNQERRQVYDRAAIEMLRAAVDSGYKSQWMQRDPELAAVRELPEFKKIAGPAR